MKRLMALNALIAAVAPLTSPTASSAQVASGAARTGAASSQTSPHPCSQVAHCGPTNANNRWTGQQTILVPYPSKDKATGAPYFPIINGANKDGAVSARSQTILQIVGSSDVADNHTDEVNIVDGFAYNGLAQYDAERYDRGATGKGAVRRGEGIGAYTFEPFDGTSDSNTAQMRADATETQDYATNHHGTSMTLSYTPNGTANLRYSGITISHGGLGGVTIGDTAYQAPPPDLGKGTLNVASDSATGGHFRSVGPTPAISACGTGSRITGTDAAGQVGNGSAITSCTIRFARAYASDPVCMVQDYAKPTPAPYLVSLSPASIRVAWSSAYNGVWFYMCQGRS